MQKLVLERYPENEFADDISKHYIVEDHSGRIVWVD